MTSYKLLILRTYRQFSGFCWLNYDRAFREHAATVKLTDWSAMNVQLSNYHTAGAQVRTRPASANPLTSQKEASGSTTNKVICRSWNVGRCITDSPLNVELFEAELSRHPDRAKVDFVLQGIKECFRLGCNKPVTFKSARRNKLSAYQHAGVMASIDVYLANEVRLGHVVGPFNSPPVHLQPGKWCLIVDLSLPQGHGVNDGIDPDSWHLQYIKIDDIIKMVSKFGPSALMAKFDIESACRNIAVHPLDCHLLGLKWRNSYYMDLALPFALRSALAIFNSVAEVVEWILVNNYGIDDLFRYLDDFILAALANSSICASNLHVAVSVVARFGLSLHPQKCLVPTS